MRASQFILLSTLSPLALGNLCPIQGPAFPAPKDITSSATFTQAKNQLLSTLDKATHASNITEVLGLDPDSISFSLQVFNPKNDQPLLEYYHTAPSIQNSTVGVREVDADTVFRIGSVSKLWTVLMLLIEKGDASFSEPVAKYVPELRDAAIELSHNATMRDDEIDHLRWDEVTIGELASHMAGVIREYASVDIAALSASAPEGFPTLPKSDIPQCGTKVACTRSEFFDGILKGHPILHTSTTPIYSNPSFQILGYALEAMTNQTYKSLLERDLIKPLGLSRSSYDKPADDTAIIPGPAASSFYGVDAGGETAAGGLYSSTRDMSTVGRAILNSTLLRPSLTRRWIKPHAHTSSLEFSVGAPWEIVTLTSPRTIDLYAKQGDLGMYSSMFALSPEHDIGFAILAAGDSTTKAVTLITDLTINTLIPAIESAAREEAKTQFAGEYSSTNATIKITTDDQPGLKVTEWINESMDIMQLLVTNLGLQNVSDLSVRLYPSGLKAPGRVGFRAVFQDVSEGDSGIGPVTRACTTWLSVDSIIYGNVGVDEFVFGVDGSGRALSVSPRALRVEIPRVEE
ncbi:beta-lactamase/transpeptidase-like protein [Aspergillus pseudotamarii]|uniref:Beta-lactamase/transpeptidase-like protein n=1 Tax=Aspergillus pseudotamarii TaxID=132259 RepID=A0A5N6SRT9_ASPPS|nr:beta-lactamase/transpeptidase-like protein [Aspergillus pseudotamarii]KAE8136501.1 beta-lactamase/transpeptidase-like protein [Aspergillus pseudotamarii]